MLSLVLSTQAPKTDKYECITSTLPNSCVSGFTRMPLQRQQRCVQLCGCFFTFGETPATHTAIFVQSGNTNRVLAGYFRNVVLACSW